MHLEINTLHMLCKKAIIFNNNNNKENLSEHHIVSERGDCGLTLLPHALRDTLLTPLSSQLTLHKIIDSLTGL